MPELIHREFVDGVQGRLQWRGNIIKLHIYGFEHMAAASALLGATGPSGLGRRGSGAMPRAFAFT
jgi:hypothetical protein